MKRVRRIRPGSVFRNFLQAWILSFIFLHTTPAQAVDGWEGHVLSLFWENDAIAGSDRHYTQGAGLSYYAADDQMPGWLNSFSTLLPSIGLDVQAQKVGFGLAQEIYTPENLRTTVLLKQDQPYAGWLFGSMLLQRRGTGPGEVPAMESIRLDLGVVGPESLAEETQKTWHGVDPGGWRHQLSFEPGINLRYHRSYLLRKGGPAWQADFIPYAGADLGNISTLIKAGATGRFGYHIPNEFAVGAGDGRRHYGVYLFSRMEGRLVGRNIFLDGNSFNRSHSVDRIPWVGNFRTGLTVVLKRVELTLSQTFLTREFDDQVSSDSYGSAYMTYKF